MGNQSTYKRFFGCGIVIELSKGVPSAPPVARKRFRASLASDKNILRLMKKIEDRLSQG
ncbi:MAG: hypothetical protein PHU49_12850 [Syntrophorhabdaceae bacterium]|nr:hypothetical protein [Syntrophorhabdaceae bacterium]MDD5244895.1 hypothetical protein [Syntrophorhabdaceae bacterium]